MILAVPMLVVFFIMTVTKSNWVGLLAGCIDVYSCSTQGSLYGFIGLIVIGLIAGMVFITRVG